MEVYRICLAEYAQDLFASGNRGRWNSKGHFVIYTASSRALACLENVVHRGGEGLNQRFRVVVIQIPDDLAVENIALEELPPSWHKTRSYALCQPLGDAWYERKTAAVLRVPSSIIASEYNYILHARHPDFARIRISSREEFAFDPRIKAENQE
ncbi:RES domain protein [Hymenobacter roseosalivarius DSM 11622]|uniref:RES domain protein n=1 Tax=Hymenobacter roseosalivarius DSM 11622 TaxID=645990 RepID=A0A1W1W2I7_9BACT|nr:RES family NAD+ phosphorylase [Hymenobacter roseosalivarius]SMB99825.1 RES domain protein [Hymenobacter roseosalivarius DSM 11622]